MNFDNEQIEILGVAQALLRECVGIKWGRYKGDVICRLVAEHIRRHLPSAYKVVGPNVYIEGNPTEFDLMVVSADAQPPQYTVVYPIREVYRIIEVKKYGIIGKREDIKAQLEKLRDKFASVLIDTQMVYDSETLHFERIDKERNWIKGFYLSLRETINPIKKTAIRYADITKEVLLERSPRIGVYILQDTRGEQIQVGEWERFINKLVGGLR